MMDLRIDNCTHHLRLKLRVAIQVSTDIFYIKVFLMFFFILFLTVHTIMNYFQPNIHIN